MAPMPNAKLPVDEAAHDVLAAEAFAVPGPDPALSHGAVVLPEDPTGIVEPHDVLAAEEFAMPAARGSGPGGAFVRRARRSRPLIAAATVLLAVLVARVLRRR